MSGISSSTGAFSGIDSGSLISQLLQIEGRPKTLVQRRVQQLQLQQTVFDSFSSKMSSLKSLAKSIREDKVFRSAKAVSSADSTLKGTASAGAATGTYQFVVDRLVTTQQSLTRGFADKDTTGLAAGTFTFESALARLDRDTALSDLNGGQGVSRGKITITDSGGRNATVDLSRVGTIGEVVEAINANGTAQVTARVADNKLEISDNAGGSITIANATGFTTAASLGIAGTATGKITGSAIHGLSRNTLLSTLNDGNGVFIGSTSTPASYSISVNVGGTVANVNLGDVWTSVPNQATFTKSESAVSTLGGVLDRMNAAFTAAGLTGVTAEVSNDGKRLTISDSAQRAIAVTENGSTGTVAALGLTGTSSNGVLTGSRVLSGMGTTLASSLNGGSGVGGDGYVGVTLRNGASFSVQLSNDWSLDEIARELEAQSGTISGQSRLKVELNDRGTGLKITDRTGGSGNLIIEGFPGSDSAASLGISTGPAGVASNSVTGANLQRKYVGRATALSSLNGGKGVGTGTFRIIDAQGVSKDLVVDSNVKNIGDLIDKINSLGSDVVASINANGDGIKLTGGVAGASKIKVEDATGSVARGLNLVAEASGTGASNTIDGSFERQVTFAATDTLNQIATKINSANAGVSAVIVNDGSSTNPWRLGLNAAVSGRAGRFVLDSGTFDLGMTMVQTGEDARAFFGSADPASGLLLSSSTNSLDNAVTNVKVDLLSVSSTPVTLTVSQDTESIISKLKDFASAFNDMVDTIKTQTAYNAETKRAAPLLGDGTALTLRSALYATLQRSPEGVSPRYSRLADIGMTVKTGGKLEIDEGKFRSALAEDPSAVESLLTARAVTTNTTREVSPGVTVSDPLAADTYTQSGILVLMERLAEKYTSSVDGVLKGKKDSLKSQIDSGNRSITAMDARLASRRTILETQFRRMESTIGRLQGQQNSILGLASLR